MLVREKPRISVSETVQTILTWPTDVVRIDHVFAGKVIIPETVILFVPGNPGLVGWYKKMLVSIIEELGVGYAARGVSYAGHGIGENIVGNGEAKQINRDTRISWTVDGQVDHKIAWVDTVNREFNDLVLEGSSGSIRETHSNENASPRCVLPKFIFMTHSIGAHLIQRVCVLRSDILEQTNLLVHLMPFIRFDPPQPQKSVLSTVARSPRAAIAYLRSASRLASSLPEEWIDFYLKQFARVDDDEGRELAVKLVRQPVFARSFLELGLEEIREVPERHDDVALRIIGKKVDTFMLFCGGPDQWAPHFHLEDLNALRCQGKIPSNIYTAYFDNLIHDFIVHPEMVLPVVDFCIKSIRARSAKEPSSRL
mmetsp:Transcript_24787/g.72613  ORF Transcript_24787/g.72613 Transcript_24787/m.72613 type:complete len:368 (-) Transcript_24787:224-1327(-)|eukprot:CAMPEP_0113536694 /NCGR_PEP_ID=MMETSP0015_2-20120614/6401_1 /TAXON_ID=2838 /ORGANISM="Odontella" /LENGTH=367 /DNA_ID=CAMNT_0000436083 /DNA_START=139 /DNA_END=1242 /DNA_ORIENTATION=- /assembly_acc=CAM_ASM_000160